MAVATFRSSPPAVRNRFWRPMKVICGAERIPACHSGWITASLSSAGVRHTFVIRRQLPAAAQQVALEVVGLAAYDACGVVAFPNASAQIRCPVVRLILAIFDLLEHDYMAHHP